MQCLTDEDEQQLSATLKTTQPRLYQHVLDCYLLSAHSYLKLEQYKTAIKNCETILRNETNHEALAIQGCAFEQLKKFSEALRCYARALEILPDNNQYKTRFTKIQALLLQAQQSEPEPRKLQQPYKSHFKNGYVISNQFLEESNS
jgi:tetratricopeptide (TPR) repeat protein